MRWHPDPADDPAEIAGYYLAHRLLVRLRQMDPKLSVRNLAMETGMSRAAAERVLTKGRLTLADLAQLVARYGADTIECLRVDPSSELFPDAYGPLLRDWVPGSPLRFAAPPDASSPWWAGALSSLAEWLTERMTLGTDRLLQQADLTLPLIEALAGAGLPSAAAGRASSVITYYLPTPIVVSVLLLPGRLADAPADQARLSLRAILEAANQPHRSIIVGLIGNVAAQQIAQRIRPSGLLELGASGVIWASDFIAADIDVELDYDPHLDVHAICPLPGNSDRVVLMEVRK